MDNLAFDLYEMVKDEIDWLKKHDADFTNLEYKTMVNLEIAGAYMLFHRGQKSEETLNDICNKLELDMSVKGLLGVRTKYQQKPLPQLNLKIEMRNLDKNLEFPLATLTNGSSKVPKLLPLNDDTRLEKVRFVEPKDNIFMELPSIVQCLVLAKL